MEKKLVTLLLRYRYWWSALTLLTVILLGAGAKNLYFESDYKAFFDEDDPQRLAHENLQHLYTKTDNLAFLIKPKHGDVFSNRVLTVIKSLTDEAWQAPYAVRVDSLSNFQHSYAEGDELIIGDLVENPATLTPSQLDHIKRIALNEKQLYNRVIAPDARTTLVNVSLDLPEIDPKASAEIQARQRSEREASFARVVSFGKAMTAEIRAEHPEMEIHLMGVPVINQSFNDSAQRDSTTLIPVMYLVILLFLAFFFRSIGAVLASLTVIGLATVAGMGFAGWAGYPLNNVTIISPIIILTIAVCDGVHLLAIYQHHLALGQSRLEAMRESLHVNLQPIVLTSVTTAVGFLTLNFSEGPNFRQLGNISAFGVMFAMVAALCLMPMLSLLLVRKAPPREAERIAVMAAIGNFVIAKKKPVFIGSLIVALALLALLPLNRIDDDPIKYFKSGVPYRDAALFSQENLPGIKNIDFSISCGEPDCIHDPNYLRKLAAFGDWIATQEGVEYVSTYIDIIKRLNRNMHGDDPSWYRLPESRKLAAQYHLLYELSLPYGLDLNNQVTFDKSATRLSVWLRQVPTEYFVDFERRSRDWLGTHYPELETPGASVHLMFATLGGRNIRSMSLGAVFALIGVTLTIVLFMRSIKYGLLSMVPNAFPAAMGMGIWGLMVGNVNMAVTTVFSITLGLVVDNTVHFLSKYRRALGRGEDSADAVRYAFSTVGTALIITTSVLAAGFGLLAFSDFNLNAYMGALTAITIVVALIFDFLMLPSLLLLIDRQATDRARSASSSGSV